MDGGGRGTASLATRLPPGRLPAVDAHLENVVRRRQTGSLSGAATTSEQVNRWVLSNTGREVIPVRISLFVVCLVGCGVD